jgi:hypothetical protein
LATLANATTLQIHYASASADELLAAAGSKTVTRAIERYTEQAVKRTHLTAFKKWVRADDHGQRFIEDPPLLVRLSGEETEHLHQIYNTYREGLPEHRRHVLRQYRFRDAARKVVGVGSVGLRAYVILLAGQGQPDPLILQVKEATSSVLTPYIGRSGCARHGERVVIGQRLLQAASDPFLGFAPHADRDYYMRQLRDMKGPTGETENTDLLNHGAGLCGATLARAHARSVDPSVISGYLGRGRRFVEALSDFAVVYADQTERDFARLEAARDSGEIAVENA